MFQIFNLWEISDGDLECIPTLNWAPVIVSKYISFWCFEWPIFRGLWWISNEIVHFLLVIFTVKIKFYLTHLKHFYSSKMKNILLHMNNMSTSIILDMESKYVRWVLRQQIQLKLWWLNVKLVRTKENISKWRIERNLSKATEN